MESARHRSVSTQQQRSGASTPPGAAVAVAVPVEDGPHAGAVRAVPVDVQPCGQQDAVLHRDGAVRERGDQQLVPT